MPTALRAMTDAELGEFRRQLKDGVIADLTAAGYDERDAAELAERQLTAASSPGWPPPQHRVCHVLRDDVQVGHVWYGPDPAGADGVWWLYELGVDGAHRGAGISAEVLAVVEEEVRKLGGTSIGLRVFDHNDIARRTYERSGYRPVSTLMRKVL